MALESLLLPQKIVAFLGKFEFNGNHTWSNVANFDERYFIGKLRDTGSVGARLDENGTNNQATSVGDEADNTSADQATLAGESAWSAN